MAQILKKNKSWMARVSWYEYDQGIKKRKFKNKSGFKTKKEAQIWANKYEVDKDNHQITDKDPAFASYFIEWAKTYRIPGKTRTSIERYYQIHKYLNNFFGVEKMSQVTHKQYQQFINEYGAHKSKSTIQKNHGTIKACVKDAQIDHIIQTDFTARTNLVWDKNKTKDIQYLSANEVNKLEENLLNNRSPKYTTRYMIITAIYTGMRIGEILALKWSDLDLINNTLSITKAYDYVAKELKEPKNQSSVRTIRINKRLVNLLKELKVNNQEFIFANSKGMLPSPAGANKTLKKHLAACGINKEGFHFHSLRHTHVAMLLFNGVQLYAISKRLGHSNMLVTAKIYSYMIDEYKAQQDKKIETILNDFNNQPKLKAL